jgi:hypothetical protein
MIVSVYEKGNINDCSNYYEILLLSMTKFIQYLSLKVKSLYG